MLQNLLKDILNMDKNIFDMLPIISELELFNNFSLKELEELIRKINIQTIEYKNKSVIVARGERYCKLYILIKGRCISKIEDYNGKVIDVAFLNAPSVIAPGAITSKDKISPVTIETYTDNKIKYTRFICIPEKDLNYLLENSIKFTRNLLSIISDRIITLSNRISFLSLKTTESKFLTYLSNLREKTGYNSIILPVKIEELALYFGVERPSLSRSISKLVHKGLIKRKKHDGKTVYEILF